MIGISTELYSDMFFYFTSKIVTRYVDDIKAPIVVVEVTFTLLDIEVLDATKLASVGESENISSLSSLNVNHLVLRLLESGLGL